MPLIPKNTPPYYDIGTGGISQPIKIYTALLTQAGTSAPTVTVLHNTIGNIIWTRNGAGVYLATLTGAFTQNKTLIFTGDGTSDIEAKIGYIWVSANVIEINTAFSLALSDDMLNGASLQITVYP